MCVICPKATLGFGNWLSFLYHLRRDLGVYLRPCYTITIPMLHDSKQLAWRNSDLGAHIPLHWCSSYKMACSIHQNGDPDARQRSPISTTSVFPKRRNPKLCGFQRCYNSAVRGVCGRRLDILCWRCGLDLRQSAWTNQKVKHKKPSNGCSIILAKFP